MCQVVPFSVSMLSVYQLQEHAAYGTLLDLQLILHEFAALFTSLLLFFLVFPFLQLTAHGRDRTLVLPASF